jgi:predicted transcriptional regulator
MQNKNESITVRVEPELAEWLRQNATAKNCKISDIIREAIIQFKNTTSISGEAVFSAGLNIKGARASVMTYRLLEKLVYELVENSNELIDAASNQAKEEIQKFKVI